MLLYVCPECKGRTLTVNPLLWHLERSHNIFMAPNQFNHITKSMVRFWERELNEKGFAACLHITKGQRDCFFFDQKTLGILEHSQCCKGVCMLSPENSKLVFASVKFRDRVKMTQFFKLSKVLTKTKFYKCQSAIVPT